MPSQANIGAWQPTRSPSHRPVAPTVVCAPRRAGTQGTFCLDRHPLPIDERTLGKDHRDQYGRKLNDHSDHR
jgi:hypothetical protein